MASLRELLKSDVGSIQKKTAVGQGERAGGKLGQLGQSVGVKRWNGP